jgi:formaldehyde-activating enzyme involved in methanogenesis
MLIMTIIKKREEAATSMKMAALNELQKGWVFLTMLAPGLEAKVLTLLNAEERERVLQAGRALNGSPRQVAYPVLETFFKKSGLKALPGKDVEEICRWLNLKFEDEPEELAGLYRKAFF